MPSQNCQTLNSAVHRAGKIKQTFSKLLNPHTTNHRLERYLSTSTKDHSRMRKRENKNKWVRESWHKTLTWDIWISFKRFRLLWPTSVKSQQKGKVFPTFHPRHHGLVWVVNLLAAAAAAPELPILLEDLPVSGSEASSEGHSAHQCLLQSAIRLDQWLPNRMSPIQTNSEGQRKRERGITAFLTSVEKMK